MSRTAYVVQAVIILLLSINIIFTASIINTLSARSSAVEGAGSGFDTRLARAWGDKVSALYNSGDHEGMYALFSEQARVKVSADQLASQLQKLRGLFGTIEDIAFLSALKLGEKNLRQHYQLFYSTRVSGKQNPVTMKLSVIVEDGIVTLYGLRITANESLD